MLRLDGDPSAEQFCLREPVPRGMGRYELPPCRSLSRQVRSGHWQLTRIGPGIAPKLTEKGVKVAVQNCWGSGQRSPTGLTERGLASEFDSTRGDLAGSARFDKREVGVRSRWVICTNPGGR
jgi:hypothetical protein